MDQRPHAFQLNEDPHRRFNALTNEWVLVSPHRATRPWQGEVGLRQTTSAPEYDPECYLCPGNTRAGGARNPVYSSTFVFDNDFAALKPDVGPGRVDVEGKGLIVAEAEPGACRVVCFSPRHDLTLGAMRVDDIELVIKAWVAEFRLLGARENIRHVQIFENRGAMMGASNPHPHCQIWATASIPEVPGKEWASQEAYLKLRRRCLLCDYFELEQRQKIRLVYQNEHFAALVPFWAVWPLRLWSAAAGTSAACWNSVLGKFHLWRICCTGLWLLTTRCSTFPSRTPWDFISRRPTISRTRNGTSMLIFIRRCCVRRRSANLWWGLRCWARRSATLLQRSQPSGCNRWSRGSRARSRPAPGPASARLSRFRQLRRPESPNVSKGRSGHISHLYSAEPTL